MLARNRYILSECVPTKKALFTIEVQFRVNSKYTNVNVNFILYEKRKTLMREHTHTSEQVYIEQRARWFFPFLSFCFIQSLSRFAAAFVA